MLTIKKLIFNPFGENTYIVWDKSKEAAIIDPGMMSDYENFAVLKFVTDNQLNLRHLINTHAHIDHIAGNGFIKHTFGLKSECNKEDEYLAKHVCEQAQMFGLRYNGNPLSIDIHLNDNDTIKIGDETVSVIYVPGHTKGHIALHCNQSDCVFTGDALFRQSIGRTDLPGGDYATLIRSVTGRLMNLPETTTIYPGHGENSTIGFEKANNPYI